LVEVPLRPGHRRPGDRDGAGGERAFGEDAEGWPRGTGLYSASIDRFLEALAQGAIFDEEHSMKKKKERASKPAPSLDPEERRKENQKWFNDLNKTIPTIPVVNPPLAVIPGFTVPCGCKGSPMYQQMQLRPLCEKCGGKGFVVIAKG
jgi:hypothetical protein